MEMITVMVAEVGMNRRNSHSNALHAPVTEINIHIIHIHIIFSTDLPPL
jgi:hypothetical protein